MKKTKLIAVLEPSETQRTRGAEVVFLRRDDIGNLIEILACKCHESWEQWGAPFDVLSENASDVELWRRSSIETVAIGIHRGALHNYGFAGSIWGVWDVQERFKCDDQMALAILDKAFDYPSTNSEINDAIARAAEEFGVEPSDESEGKIKVFELLKAEYLKSDVVSGEFIHSAILTLGFSEDDVRGGVQLFLDWDESSSSSSSSKLLSQLTRYGRLHWIIKETNS
jgi:hypothetical protein